MNKSLVNTVMTEARDCAMAMLENATYIQGEINNVEMTDELRAQTEKVCDSLIGTKHDIIHEVFEVDELLEADAPDSKIYSSVNLIMQWLQEEITGMHHLVMSLQSAHKQNPAYLSAYILVMESATNILNAFNLTREVAESLFAEASGTKDA